MEVIMLNINTINSLVLAYLGDSIYELYIRKSLIGKKLNKVNDLQKEAVKYVSAKGQAMFLEKLINLNYFSNQELDIIKRARNSKPASHPKNVDILTYKHATAFEALIGYLYLNNNIDRIEEIINYIIGEN
jgi:ribonuclease-3 family protein